MRYIKFNWIYVCLGVLSAFLIAFLGFTIADDNKDVAGIVNFVCFLFTITPFIAMSHTDRGVNANLRILSLIFLFFMVVSNLTFVRLNVQSEYYIITEGLLLIIYLAFYLKIASIEHF